MTRGNETRRVLIVDDEEALVWSLSSRLQKARPGFTVGTASDGTTALARLLASPVDLLVADVRLPGMTGLELVLSARQQQPRLPIIVMTAFKSPEVSNLTQANAIPFLEKPFSFEQFLAAVDRALAPSEKGFSGAISVQTLPDVVQLYVLSSATGALTVRHGEDEGCVWFDKGAISHAATRQARGDEAVFEIMMWSGGDFSMHLGAAVPERSVQGNWQELLMESCRRIDERDRRGDAPPMSSTGWTLSPPSNPDADPFAEFLFDGPALAQSLRQPPPFKEPTMNIKDCLTRITAFDGFVGAAIVDSESGMLLGAEGGGPVNLEIAAAGNTEVVRAKRKTMGNLGLKDNIEDILITLGKQYHIIRPLRGRPGVFFYVVVDRQRANLAMARIGLADVEKDLQF